MAVSVAVRRDLVRFAPDPIDVVRVATGMTDLVRIAPDMIIVYHKLLVFKQNSY